MNNTLKRFVKYSGVGVSTFLFDLLLLFVLTDFLSVNYLVATTLAFLIAVSINYYVSRKYVFKATSREVRKGYVIFIIIALIGALLVTAGMFVLVDLLQINYLFARILIAGVVGFWNYIMNLFVNFRVAGNHI